MSRVIVIGLDGATLPVIRKVTEKFELPNLAKMLRQGSSGILESTIPYISPPGWISMVTGTNPGKHGIYDFLRLTKENSLKLVCFNDCQVKALWNILSEHEKKVVIANIPVTYPASQVNGIFISGPFAPKLSAYPKEWERKLIDMGYKQEMLAFEAKTEKFNKESILSQLLSIERSRRYTFTKLLKEEKWDFYMAVFTFPDRSQHFGLDTENFSPFYQILDAFLGDVIAEMGKEDILMIASDHGDSPVSKRILINRWFMERGLLSLKQAKLGQILSNIGLTKEALQSNWLLTNIFSRLSKYIPSLYSLALKLLNFVPSRHGSFDLRRVDFEKSKAFAYGSRPLCFINIISHDPTEHKRLYKLIKDFLLTMKDPARGGKCIKNIYSPNDIYQGPCTKFAPHMIIEPEKEYILDSRYVGNQGMLIEDTGSMRTSHALEGILLAYGDNIRAANNIRAEIVDITPTILHHMGLPVPVNMDGRFLREIFHESSESAKREVIYQHVEKEKEKGGPREELTKQEEDEVKKRLRDLGYL